MGNRCCRVTEDNSMFTKQTDSDAIFDNPTQMSTDFSNINDIKVLKQIPYDHPKADLSTLPKYENSFNSLVCNESAVTCVTMWENQYHGSRLICGDASGSLHWYQIGSNERGIMRQVHDRSVSALCPLANGYLASGSADKHINLISAKKMKIKATLSGHNFRVNALAPGYDISHLLSGGRDGTVRVWDTNLCSQLHSTWREGNVVTGINPIKAHNSHSSARIFYQTSEQPIIRLWSYDSGRLDDVIKFGTCNESISCSDTTPNGFQIAAGTRRKGKTGCGILVYDVRKATTNAHGHFSPHEDSPALIQRFSGITPGRAIEAIRFVTWSSVLAVSSDGSLIRANMNTGLITHLSDCSTDPFRNLSHSKADERPFPTAVPRDENSPPIEFAEINPDLSKISLNDDHEDECDDEREESLAKGPTGISAAFILPRLRYRKFSSSVALWPKDSCQAQTDVNTAFVVTATHLTARDDAETKKLGSIPAVFESSNNNGTNLMNSSGDSHQRPFIYGAREYSNYSQPSASDSNPQPHPRHSLISDNTSNLSGNFANLQIPSQTSLDGSIMVGQRSPTGELSPRGSNSMLAYQLASQLNAPGTVSSPVRTAGLGVFLTQQAAAAAAAAANNNLIGSGGLFGGNLSGNHPSSCISFDPSSTGVLTGDNYVAENNGSLVRLWEAQERKIYAMRPSEQTVAFLEEHGGIPSVPVIDEVEGTNIHSGGGGGMPRTQDDHSESLAGSPVRQPNSVNQFDHHGQRFDDNPPPPSPTRRLT